MPSRKQRRREQKSKRHQYEFVYVDAEGNELDEPPPELVEAERQKRDSNGSKPAAAKQQGKQSTTRARGEPPAPSWNRAVKRGGMLGAVVFALFALSSKGHYLSVIPLAVVYTVLFIPFTYWIDRFAYRRYQARRASEAATQRPAKKR